MQHTDDDNDEGQQGRRHDTRRQSDMQPQQPSLTRSLGLALAVISIAGSVFVAGYNWRSVSILELQQEQFVRKDVQQEQLRNINYQLLTISDQLAQVRAELERERTRHPSKE